VLNVIPQGMKIQPPSLMVLERHTCLVQQRPKLIHRRQIKHRFRILDIRRPHRPQLRSQVGTPAAGARLIFDQSNGSRSFSSADRDGNFLLTPDGTPDGPYTLYARLGPLGSNSISSPISGDFTLTLLPNVCRPLIGRVLDDQGHPIEGAVVLATKDPTFSDAGARMTAADGTFRFEKMWPNFAYRLTARANGYRLTVKTVRFRNGAFPSVEIKLRATIPTETQPP
jgi:hypothetical protein